LFTPTFRTPEDEVEDQLPAGSCRIAAHGRLGQKPIRAILDAAGVNLTLKLSIVASGETIIYRGELARSPCVDELSNDEGILRATPRSAARASSYPRTLFVSLGRSRGRLNLEGRSRVESADVTLDSRDTPLYLRTTYDALARPLFAHAGAAVDIADAIDDDKGTILSAYRHPNGPLELVELGTARRRVRASVVTGLGCMTRDCQSRLIAARPRPGVVLIIAVNQVWDCVAASCTGVREVELWTLTARGFQPSGRIPAAPLPTDSAERPGLTSLRWVTVDGRSRPDLIVGLHLRPDETSSLWLFTFEPALGRYGLDPRLHEPTADVLAVLAKCVRFGVW